MFVSISKIESLQRIPKAASGVELRLDLFPSLDVPKFEKSHPVIFTLRRVSHGGKFLGRESLREAHILKLLELKPDFFDLECDMRPAFLKNTLKSYPETKFILSYHNFQNTPQDLDAIFRLMNHYPANYYKIAAMAQSTNDALRMLLFAKKHPRLSVICMGDKGAFARILGKVSGQFLHYASLESQEQTAPGQISASDLENIYRFSSLNQKTALYGLIGDPIHLSQGHIYHNTAFAKRSQNAVYVKMSVKPDELADFFPLAKQLGFQGLSVTMPLKEAVLPFLDEIDGAHAVNTLLFKKERIFGTNTDGKGALDALEKRGFVRNKIIVLIGAGGAAKSIASEAIARGAKVRILNRTVQKAKDLAVLLQCEAGGLSDFPIHYDILVHCSANPMPIDPAYILSSALVMDIVYVPKETVFLKEAARLGCSIVYGEEMFWNQAAAQSRFFQLPCT